MYYTTTSTQFIYIFLLLPQQIYAEEDGKGDQRKDEETEKTKETWGAFLLLQCFGTTPIG